MGDRKQHALGKLMTNLEDLRWGFLGKTPAEPLEMSENTFYYNFKKL